MSKKPHVLSDRFSDPDLVDRIFDYLAKELAHVLLSGDDEVLRQAKSAVRDEFGGTDKVYVKRRDNADEHRRQIAQAVLSNFNGRNATTIARELGIGRATVFRILKQSRNHQVEE